MAKTEWLTVPEAAKLAKRHPNYIRKLIRQGKIIAEKRSGHDLWIDKASVEAYTKAMRALGTNKHNSFRK